MCKDKNSKCACPACKQHVKISKSLPSTASLIPSGFTKKSNENSTALQPGSGYPKKNEIPVIGKEATSSKPITPANRDGDASGAYIAGISFFFLLVIASRRE